MFLTAIAVPAVVFSTCLRRMRAPLASAAASSSGSPRLGRYATSVEEAGRALADGELVAFPTETVFGLGANAFNVAAVCRIFEVKGRPRTDPLIVHVPTVDAAERLVRLEPRGLALMRKLAASFWPGPLTLVAPASADIPDEITSGTGFVGLRVPAHEQARSLLSAAGVPVAAPSANRFGHVSPTRAEHVMSDLGAHQIWVLRAADGDETSCGVGIESTVLKIDESASRLIVLRRGGVPEAELARWMLAHPEEGSVFSLHLHATSSSSAHNSSPLQAATGHDSPTNGAEAATPVAAATITTSAAANEQPSSASATATDDDDTTIARAAPGMLLTHYAPDLPAFLLAPAGRGGAVASEVPLGADLSTAVLIDFGARYAALASRAVAYRDLSATGDGAQAARSLFETLRWAEDHADAGARCVLLPLLGGNEAVGGAAESRGTEVEPALADRLYRAASGRRVWLDPAGGALCAPA